MGRTAKSRSVAVVVAATTLAVAALQGSVFHPLPVRASGGPSWVQLSPTASPPSRSDSALAYDVADGQVVLFGGESATGGALGDTWVWNGTSWSQPSLLVHPPARWGAAIAYDDATGSIVMFGGYDGTSYLNDAWSWSKGQWLPSTANGLPSPRADASLTYDVDSRQMILFGGYNGQVYLGDTYVYGSTWTAASPTTSPPARAQAGFAYDEANRTAVLFGGISVPATGGSPSYLADTWVWNGSTWQPTTPANQPPARAGSSLTYDPATSRPVLFGGVNASGTLLADTWSWDGGNWNQEAPVSSPSARSLAAATISISPAGGARGCVLLFGGTGSTGATGDTWTWQSTASAPQAVAAIPGDGQATVRWQPSPSDGGSAITGYTVTAFTGSGSGPSVAATGLSAVLTGLSNGVTYTFTVAANNATGAGPSSTSNPTTPANTPSAPTSGNGIWLPIAVPWDFTARYEPAVGTDSAGDVVIFGGRDNYGKALGDVWIWNGGSWTHQWGGTLPARWGATFAYDPSSGTTVLFGGTDGHAYLNDTWMWQPGGWHLPTVNSQTLPTPRAEASAAYDANAANVVLFGGHDAAHFMGDTWMWTTTGWQQASSSASPPARAQAVLASDPVHHNLVLFGGDEGLLYPSGGSLTNDTWTWDGTNWTQQNPGISPPAESGSTAFYDGRTSEVTLVGGATPSQVNGDTWTWSGSNWLQQSPGSSAPPRAGSGAAVYGQGDAALLDGGCGSSSCPPDAWLWVAPSGAPTGVATQAGNGQVTVSWTAPTTTGGQTPGYYTVATYSGSSPVGSPVTVSTTSATITGLTNGTSYTFQVAATNSGGLGASATSEATIPSGPPGMPATVAVAPGDQSITVVWTGPTNTGGGPITGYTVTPLQNGTPGTPVQLGPTSFATTITGLSNGVPYTVAVAASSAGGIGPARISSTVSPTAAAPATLGDWQQLSPAQHPSSRVYATAAATGQGSQVLMFGGKDSSGNALGDTWLWDGSNWQQLVLEASPPARWGGSMFAMQGKVFLFGGYNGTTYLNDVWYWTPGASTWTPFTTAPPPRAFAEAAANPVSNTAVLFGGYNGASYLADTWTFNGTTWSQKSPATVPAGRSNSAVAYDYASGSIIMFGGVAAATTLPGGIVTSTQLMGDTWSWDGSTWTQLSPSASPSARMDATIAPDQLQKQLVLFGGDTSNGAVADTWSWDGSNWSSRTAAHAPSARYGAVAAASGSALVVVSGAPATGLANDTWAWTTTPGTPTAVVASFPGGIPTVQWQAPDPGGHPIIAYVVTAYDGNSASGLTTVPAGSGSAQINGLNTGTSYRFQVAAINQLGGSPLGISGYYPSAPGSLVGVAGNSQAQLSWTAASSTGSSLSGYQVAWSGGSQNLPPTSVGTTVTNLANCTTVNFQVSAQNTTGSGPAASDSLKIGAASAPTGVQATAGNGQATVTWSPPAYSGGGSLTGYVVQAISGWQSASVGPGATSAVVGSLTNGQTYTFEVRADNGICQGTWSSATNAVTPATHPDPPTNVQAVAANSQAFITWTPPSWNGGAAITGYTVTAAPGGAAASVDGSHTSAIVGGLTNGTTYTFTVTASNWAGTSAASSPSNAVTPARAPDAPTNVQASAQSQSAVVTWTTPAFDGGSAITSYTITASPGGATQTVAGATSTSGTVGGLQNGVSYTFTVHATNQVGNGTESAPSNPVTPTPLPQAPVGVSATPGDTQATISWTAPYAGASPITGYTITAYVGSSPLAPAYTTGTSLTYAGLQDGTTYTFQVYATNSYGNGPPATSAAIVVAAVPSAPQNVAATGGNAAAQVTWSAPSSNGGATITSYTVTPYLNGSATTPTVTVSGITYSALVSGLQNGVSYTFGVSASNTTGPGPSAFSVAVQTGVAPAPTSVTAVVAGDYQLTVAWTPGTEPGGALISGYRLVATTAGEPNTQFQVSGTTTSTTISGLKGGSPYTVTVTAWNAYSNATPVTSNSVTPTGGGAWYPDVVRSDGAIVYYRLNDPGSVAFDSSGHGQVGSYSGGATQVGGEGPADSDSAWSANSNYMQDTTVTGLPTGTQPRTFEAWLNTTANTTQSIVAYGQQINGCGGDQTGMALQGNNQVEFITSFDTNGTIVLYGLTFNASGVGNGNWHHVVMTWNGSTVVAYMDGQVLGSQAFSSNEGGVDSNGLIVGASEQTWNCFPATPGFRFNGILDEVAVYPSALTATQVLNHFNASGNFRPTAPAVGVTAVANNRVTVSWAGSATSAGAPITGYVVTALKNGTQALNAVGAAANATSVTLDGLQGGVPYSFQVAGVNNFGTGSAGTSPGTATPLGGPLSYAAQVQQDGAIAQYRFTEAGGSTLADSSGHGNTAALAGSYSFSSPGALATDSDPGMQYSGGYAQHTANSYNLPTGTQPRSFEAWIKTTSTGNQSIVAYGGTRGGPGYHETGMGTRGGNTLSFIYGFDNNGTILYFTNNFNAPNIANGQWHYVVITWDGNTLSAYMDDVSLGTQSFSSDEGGVDYNGLLIGASENNWNNGNSAPAFQFSGSLDEVAVYPTALTAAQIQNHWTAAGAGLPNAPTQVTATALQNGAKITWTPPTAAGGSPITTYQVTPYIGGKAGSTITVSGSSTSAVLSDLMGGEHVSAVVAAVNMYGVGPSGTSNTVTVPAGGAANRLLYLATAGSPPRGIYFDGFDSQALPAMSQWTIEGYIGGMRTNAVTTGNMAWGVLNTTPDMCETGTNCPDTVGPSAGSPMAGINFDIGDMTGCLCVRSQFVWPGGSWDFTQTSNGVPTAATGDQLGYFTLEYDGSTVTGYINGQQVFSQASTSAALASGGLGGFMDQSELNAAAFDEFRVSNVARYSGNFTPPSGQFASDANTQLLLHFDDYPVGKLDNVVLTPFGPNTPQGSNHLHDSSGYGRDAQIEAWTWVWSGAIGWMYYSPELFQPIELAPGITNGELADSCNGVNIGSGSFCQQFKDLTLPGRGIPITLGRTYNSVGAGSQGRFGYGWSDTYSGHLTIDASGGVTIWDGSGGSTAFTNQGGTYTPASYNSASLTYASGTYTLAAKDGGKQLFNSSGKLIQLQDRNGYSTSLQYNANGQLTTVTDPAGRTLGFSYWPSGVVQSVTDGVRTVSYGYDGSLNLTSVTDVLGGVTNFTYDSSHRLLSIKSPICNQTSGCNGLTNNWDGNGRVSQQADQTGKSTTFAYSSAGPLFTTTITDPLGRQTAYEFAHNLLLDVVAGANSSLAATTKYSFDPTTYSITSITDPAGAAKVATYDAQGNMLSVTDSLGNTYSYTYNSLAEPLTVQDPIGTVTTNVYDSHGNLLSRSTPLTSTGQNKVTTFFYEDASHPGDVTKITDPTGRSTHFTYDQYGDKASETDNAGDTTTYSYDSVGRLVATVSPLGNVAGATPSLYTTTYTVNAAGQPLTVTDPLGHQASTQYDLEGRPQVSTDADGNITKTVYDLDGRTTSVTSGYGTPQATTKQLSYDADGEVLTQTDGLNHTLVSRTYDGLGRVLTSSDGLGRATSFSYDSVGRPTTAADTLSQTTTYSYDTDGRLTQVSYTDGLTHNVSYTYDALGRPLTMQDGTGTTNYSYDSLDRLTQQTDGAGKSVAYGYDLAGRVTSIAYPGGNCTSTPQTLCVTRQFDTAGRPASVRDWLGNQTSFGYDANSNLTGIGYPNGVTDAFNFNKADQLTSINDTAGASGVFSATYTRDNNGQVGSENGGPAYAYSPLNQVTGASGVSYTYDLADRLTQTVSGNTTTNFNYDNADQLTSTSVVGGTSTSYGYDAAGRRTQSGSTALTWNQANQLLSFGSSASYAYNGDGLRTSKIVGGTSHPYTWDLSGSLPVLLQDGSTYYVSGPGGLPLEQISGSTAYFFHRDQIGSTRTLTDAQGNVVASFAFDAYGNMTSQSGSVSTPFLFAGQYRDPESGLYYLQARYYDPATGQFTSRDPKVESTWDPYSYVGGNPINATDPSGQCDGIGGELMSDLSLGTSCGGFGGGGGGGPDIGGIIGNFLAGLGTLGIPDFSEGQGATLAFRIGWAIGAAQMLFLGAGLVSRMYEAVGVEALERVVGSDVAKGALDRFIVPIRDFFAGRAAPEALDAASAADGGPGAMARLVFESSPKHPDLLAHAGQSALDVSLRISENSTRRIGIDYASQRFVVFDETYPGQGIFHGHYRTWDELSQPMQSLLRRWGMASGRGDILTGPGA